MLNCYDLEMFPTCLHLLIIPLHLLGNQSVVHRPNLLSLVGYLTSKPQTFCPPTSQLALKYITLRI